MIWIALPLFAVDLALRPWRPFKDNATHNLVYVLLAYVPILLVPLGSARMVTLAAAVIALLALVSYARMVGLSQHWRFFAPTLLAAAACFLAARVHWYGLFQAMPVFGLFLVVAAAVIGREPDAFLQKLCLAWLGLLVYGYLWAHAALFTDPDMIDHRSGHALLALVILLAKFGDVAWVATRRLRPTSERMQLWISPLAGLVGGVLVQQLLGIAAFDVLAPADLPVLGAIVGGGMAFASRSYNLVVEDVLGGAANDLRRPLKGTMLFGFAFALALAFHWLRYRAA